MALMEARETLGSAGLQHDGAQLSIAAALTGADPAPVEECLDDASRALFRLDGLGVRGQAGALATLLTDDLRLEPVGGEPRGLLIDEALARREAHPMMIAVVGHELARRAGLQSFVGAIGPRYWTVLTDGVDSALVGCELLEVPPTPVSIQPRCPHAVAAATLKRLRALGPAAWQPRIEELLDALPLRSCRRDEAS
jgi:hypothetical protein